MLCLIWVRLSGWMALLARSPTPNDADPPVQRCSRWLRDPPLVQWGMIPDMLHLLITNPLMDGSATYGHKIHSRREPAFLDK